ncbi:MAG: cobalamin-binding protein [Anaerolineae bacterium]|nr:cobalamin-binding protein [Anaerolineae bacterium]
MKIINRFNTIFSLTAIILLALLSGGCTQTTAPSSSPPETTPAPAAAFPLTLTDDLDREVTLPARPERIVSLLPSNTEILFTVGAGDQVVGVTSYCNYPPEATSREPVGGITNKSLSVETIVALEPDLVLASDSQDEIIPVLEQASLTVLALNPATFDDIYANIEMVGQATGHLDQATALTAEMRRRVATVSAKVDTIPADTRPSVFYEVWHDPLMTAGPNTFIGQMINIAGGKNIFADVNEDWPQVSAETIVERNPTIIFGPANHSDELTIEQITTRPGWADIAAVQNEQIYILDGDAVSRPGPRVVDVLEEIARDLYPDLF